MLHKERTTCSDGWEERNMKEALKKGALVYLKAGSGWGGDAECGLPWHIYLA